MNPLTYKELKICYDEVIKSLTEEEKTILFKIIGKFGLIIWTYQLIKPYVEMKETMIIVNG